MPIAADVDAYRLGATLIDKLYLGASLIWSPQTAGPLGLHGKYKGAHNTGIASVGLTAADLTIFTGNTRTGFTPGATYTRMYFPMGARPQANDLTFVECLFEANSGQSALSLQDTQYTGRTFTRCTLDGQDFASTSFGTLWGGTGTLEWCEIRGGFDNCRGGSNLKLHDCYLHNPVRHPDSHTDIFQILGGNDGEILRCRLGDSESINAAIQLGQLTAVSNNWLVHDNFFGGNTNFTINYNPTGQPVSGWQFRRNIFSNAVTGPSGGFGALHSDVTSRNNGITFDIDATNIWEADGVPVTTRNARPS